MVLLKLWWAFFKIGLFAIGGAYSFLPLLEKDIVESYNWLSREEFLDVLGMVKMFPGAISIKFATYTGYKLAGFPGAVAANIGNLLAPAVLVLCVSVFYTRYKDALGIKRALEAIRLAVFSMILAVAFQTITLPQLLHLKGILIIVASFILFMYTKINPAFVIIGIGVLGMWFR